MAQNTLEISVNGKWVAVPALHIDGKAVVVTGKFVKIAAVHDESWLESELETPRSCIDGLRARESGGLKADIFTFAQRLPATNPRYPYPVEWDSIAAIRLTTFEDWWRNLPQETRKNARRAARRGVVVKIQKFHDALIKDIVALNNDSPMRQNVAFAHYGKTFDEVKRDYSSFSDRSHFICAYLDEELIGLIKLVNCGRIAAIMQLLTKSSQYEKRPANALIAKAVEHCVQTQMSYLTYCNYSYGNKRQSSLSEFKSRNGFQEILVPRFYIPLTIRGKIGMKLKLHRDLLALLPESAIRWGLSFRAGLYKLRRVVRRCSSMPERPSSNRQMERSNPPAGSN